MIEEWLNDYGEITSFSFMIYSSSMSTVRYCQSIEDVDEELAIDLNVKRGLNVQWIFPQTVHSTCQKMIINIIEEGLKQLNIAYDLYGVFGDAN